jgi:rfaE bifunctional protein nucleotidyltransferase chain/domain
MKKLIHLEEAAEITRKAQRIGLQVVMANGCFDLLHVGHIRYLLGAKAEGDILIVALNGDSSVQRLKGPNRPLMPESERAEILSALSMIDFILLFDADTVDEVLRVLRPDVHAKGTDYTEKTVPERETVLAYGGRVAIVGDPKDHSTSDYLEAIQSNSKPDQ